MLNIGYADIYTWDFNEISDFSLSDNNSFYQANSSIKLRPVLTHSSHLENGPVVFDGGVNIYTEGDYAYVASYGGHAITVVNISDPNNPTAVGYLGANGSVRLYGAYDLIKKGDYLFVVSYTSDSLEIIDVSDPTNPQHITRVNNVSSLKLNGARGLTISGDYAFIASYIDDSMQIIDISDPINPSPVSYVQDTTKLNGLMDIKIKGNYAFASAYLNDSIAIIDISSITNPVIVGEINNGVNGALIDGPWGLEISGNTLFAAGHVSDTFQSFDITNQLIPVLSDSVNNGSGVDLNGIKEFRILGDNVYIAATNGDALQVLDISDPSNITPVSTFETDSFGKLDAITGIALSGDNAYVTSYTNGTFQSIDISNPAILQFQGELGSGENRLGNNTALFIEDNHAYVTAYGSHSLEILNINQPNSPTHEGSISDSHTTNELRGAWTAEKKGDYVYVGSNTDNGIEIINVSDPSNPSQVAKILDSTSIELQGVRGLDIVENYLYAVGYSGDSLQIIDITDPTNPIALGNIKDSIYLNGAIDVEVQGDIAYVVSYARDSISAIDVSDPNNPQYISELRNTSSTELNGPYMLYLNGDYAYISAYVDDGIQVVDIRDPSNMVALGSYANDSFVKLNGPRNFVYDEGLLYLGVFSDDSVQIMDVSDPNKPEDVSYVRHTNFLDTVSATAKDKETIYATTYYGSSFETIEESYSEDIPYLKPQTAFVYIGEIINIEATTGGFHEGNITYQLSLDDGANWHYHNGTAWMITTQGSTQSNSIQEISSNLLGLNSIPTSTHKFLFKAYYSSDGHQKVELDNFTITTQEVIKPIISGSNTSSGSLLPGGNHSLKFTYSDEVGGSGIDLTSAVITLKKWDGASWGGDISSTSFGQETITNTIANYPTHNLSTGKYQVSFSISDISGNTAEIYTQIFYIDIPSFTVSKDSIDIGTLSHLSSTFAPTLNLEVKTLGVPYRIYLNGVSQLACLAGDSIPFYNGTHGIGFNTSGDGVLNILSSEQLIASGIAQDYSNGEHSTTTHSIDMGGILPTHQIGGEYEGEVSFRIEYDY